MSIDHPNTAALVTRSAGSCIEEESFQDALYDWMQRAPWLAISAAAHLVILLIIQAFPWALFDSPPEIELTTSIAKVAEPLPEPPPPEPDQIIEPDVVDEIPVIQEIPTDIVDSENFSDEPSLDPPSDAGALAASPFLDMGSLGELGLGGPPGGKYTGRFGPGGGGVGAGRGTAPSMEAHSPTATTAPTMLYASRRGTMCTWSAIQQKYVHATYRCGYIPPVESTTHDIRFAGL